MYKVRTANEVFEVVGGFMERAYKCSRDGSTMFSRIGLVLKGLIWIIRGDQETFSPKQSTESKDTDRFVRWVPRQMGAVWKEGKGKKRKGKINHTELTTKHMTEDLNMSDDM